MLAGGAGAQPALQRILDTDFEDEVFEIEAEKRRARLSDMQGGRIAQDDPRRAIVSQALAAKATRGPDYNPDKTEVAEAERRRQERMTAWGMKEAPRGSPLLEAVKKDTESSRQGQVQAFAKARVLAKVPALRKLLAPVAKYTATPDPLLVAYKAAANGGNFVEAEKLQSQLEGHISTTLQQCDTKLPTLESRLATWKEGGLYVPTDLEGLAQEATTATGARDWMGAPEALSALERRLNYAAKLRDRLRAVEEAAADEGALPNAQHRKNLTKWVDMHKKFTWEEVEASLTKVYTEGSLAHLEDKVKDYRARTESGERAARALEEARAEGRVCADGTVLAKKKVSELTGDEKTAVEDALSNYDASTVPTLSHPHGMKWGAAFANRDGDLPTASGYQEYYVEKATGDPTYHGGRRLVVKGTRFYYTWTHYGDNGRPAFVFLDRS
jgi:hypothetical protein